MNINFNAFLQQGEVKDDFQRLMELCSSYGLNQEETNQIITDFKNGSFCNEQSIDQSFQQSLRDLENPQTNRSLSHQEQSQNYGEQDTVNQASNAKNPNFRHFSRTMHDNLEEYSFKDGRHSMNVPTSREKSHFEEEESGHVNIFNPNKKINKTTNTKKYGEENFNCEQSERQMSNNLKQNLDNTGKNKFKNIHVSSQNYSHSVSSINEELLENFIFERREFENHIYMELEKENKQLKKHLREKDQKIDLFMKMKVQDSEIILGLQETLAKMGEMLKEKQRKYDELSKKYEKERQRADQYELAHKMSKSTLAGGQHQESINSLDERRSIGSKQNVNTNNNNGYDFERKMANCGSSGRLSSQNRPHNMERQPSNKGLQQFPQQNSNRDLSRQQLSKSNIQIKNQTPIENLMKKSDNRSGIDISKYKGMIQKLRSSYEFK